MEDDSAVPGGTCANGLLATQHSTTRNNSAWRGPRSWVRRSAEPCWATFKRPFGTRAIAGRKPNFMKRPFGNHLIPQTTVENVEWSSM